MNSICLILKSEDLYLFQPGFDKILINYQQDRGLPIGIELILNGYLPKMHSIVKNCSQKPVENQRNKTL